MRHIQNERGVALVMVLIFAMIGLAIVTGMLFMLTQGSRMSGAFKTYRSADEAGLGGASLVTEMIKSRGVITANPYWGLNATYNLDACLQQKLATSRGVPNAALDTAWTSCGNGKTTDARLLLDPATAWDMNATLPGPAGSNFVTYMKIVDTVEGNTETGGLVGSGQLGGTGVVSSTSGQVTPPAVPYMYRIEVQTQNTVNPTERSHYSVLYAH